MRDGLYLLSPQLVAVGHVLDVMDGRKPKLYVFSCTRFNWLDSSKKLKVTGIMKGLCANVYA